MREKPLRITHHASRPDMTNPIPPPADFYCAQLSLENEEFMAGTAVSAPVWVLLEYRQLWQAEATRDNTLPVSVKMWLDEQLKGVNGRLQFIRQTPYHEPYRCFVSIPDAQNPRLYRFEFAEYEELLDLDLAAVANGAARYSPNLSLESLFLVCTNGKRDRCCAKFGMVLYQALANVAGTAVWQTTHLGGHRFAPTLVTFPAGISYGRVTLNDVPGFLAAQQNEQLFLPCLRGRVNYDAVTQAAEYYLCQHLNQTGLTAFEHLRTIPGQANDWVVQFRHPDAGQIFQIDIIEERTGPVFPSCGVLEPKTVPYYRLHHLSAQ
ncbi:MAG: sucrase ferredoxin [Chloroflexota bacterium]